MAAPLRLRGARRQACGRPEIGPAAFSLSDADAARVEAEACRLPNDVGLPVTHWSASLLGDHIRAEGIEILERRYLDSAMKAGQPMRREFEYVRHGTLCWMGAFDVRRGKPFGFASDGHNSDTFIELLDLIEAVYPAGRGHIIMDNLSAHDTPDVNEWFDEHPRWTRHFTPKHASWLNQIECWFSILSRHLLTRGSFSSIDDLAAKLDAYLAWYLQTDRPFRWSYRPKSWSP